MNLVFASGFLFPQSLGPVAYFRGLKDHIAQSGLHNAIFPLIDPLGGLDGRADALARAIAEAYPEGPIHIIAHSMGGLDSRVLIGRDLRDLSGRIASLTTVATPHRGSPIADLLAGRQADALRRRAADAVTAVFLHLGIDTGALADLTTERAAQVPDI